jgi:hypothetical protein
VNKFLLTGLLLSVNLSAAQTAAPAPSAPTTTLDAFLSQSGVLTVRESLGTKNIPVKYGGSFSLEAVKLYTPGQESSALLGIAIKINDGEKYSSSRTEFVEFSEIEGMTKAVEYMVSQSPKLNISVSPEVKFISKSSAVIGVFYSDYEKKFSGFAKASTETVYMDVSSLSTIQQSLLSLKTLLK